MVKHFAILAVITMLVPAWASDPGIHRLEARGLNNVFAISAGLYSGSAPEDDEGFESLRKLGIRTILSVDGSKPDLNRAHQFGFRYIHLPHGYDGIPEKTQVQLAKAAETAEGPIYVHCHHGQHRGPAAAAIICMANKGWTSAQAENWLHAAGTATNYVGLFSAIRDFKPITAEQLKSAAANFPESQEISGLVDRMVALDRQFENLKAIRKAGFKTPPDHPDLVPANEALLLTEHFRELQRALESESRGEAFLRALRSAEVEARSIETLLRNGRSVPIVLEKSFNSLAMECASCHKTFRDTPIKTAAK